MTKNTTSITTSTATITPASDTRWWDWPSAVLVILLLLTASGRLVTTRWTDGLVATMDFVILGTILGMALGRSLYHPILAILTSIAYGVLIIPWRLGSLLIHGISWQERVISMVGRINSIVRQIVNQTDVTDSFLFIVLMSCLFWIISVNAGYVLTRYANAWRIVIPAGLTAIVIHYYHNCPVVNLRQCVNIDVRNGSSIIAVYMLISLLLIARIYYIRQTHNWHQRHTFIHSDVGFDLMRVTVVAVVVLMALSWTAPAFGNKVFDEEGPLKSLNRTFHTASQFFSHVFASLRFSVGPSTEFFSKGLALGRGSEISYNMVLQVNAPKPSETGGDYYWQARVYDQYANGVWTSDYPITKAVEAQEAIMSSAAIQGRSMTSYDFYAYKNLGLLFYPAQVVSASRPVIVHLSSVTDLVPDVSMLELEKQLYSGERYQVRSSSSAFTERELRDAGVNYPNWVLEQYIQLPPEITPRTRALAKDITEGLTNPYDISQAITIYLRENITYTRVIAPLPADQEVMDWFLFDLKQGFCHYYASAEVILLRSLGIPARMVVGYAQGDVVVQAETPGLPQELRSAYGPQTYQVREKDAHAWPQVYFPDFGWIEFEPTSSIRQISRPTGEEQPAVAPQRGVQDEPNLDRPTPEMDEPTKLPDANLNTNKKRSGLITTTTVVIIASLLGLLDISILIWRVPMARKLQAYYKRWGAKPPAFIDKWASEEILPIPARVEGGLRNLGIQPPGFLRQWALYARLNPVGRAYFEINRALRRLGARPTPDVTPAERASLLTRIIPNTAASVKSLLTEYQFGMYSQHPVDTSTARLASRKIRKLSYMALFARWMDRLGQPVRRGPKKVERK
jgi:transglutaminase-like putative cysteine protease